MAECSDTAMTGVGHSGGLSEPAAESPLRKLTGETMPLIGRATKVASFEFADGVAFVGLSAIRRPEIRAHRTPTK
jgi:hypothetical protein